MDHLFKKAMCYSVTGVALMFSLSSTPVFAQDTSAAPGVASADGAAPAPGKTCKHHGKRKFFMGMCVGQYLLTSANPPVTFTPGQKPTKAQWSEIKAAKTACRAAFGAGSGLGGAGGGTGSGTQE